MKKEFAITEISNEHSQLVVSFITSRWGSTMSVSKGRILNVADLPGFLCIENDEIIGLITYTIDGENCEIVTLNSLLTKQGLATQLIMNAIEKAKESDCRRVWLITTNDNTNAIKFYQKREFEWVGFYKDAMNMSRNLKPEIPEFGNNGIPIRHEIEFELSL